MVTPKIKIGLALFEFTNGMLPIIDIIHTVSVSHTSSGKTYKTRFNIGYHLCQIFAQSVLAVPKCFLWKQ